MLSRVGPRQHRIIDRVRPGVAKRVVPQSVVAEVEAAGQIPVVVEPVEEEKAGRQNRVESWSRGWHCDLSQGHGGAFLSFPGYYVFEGRVVRGGGRKTGGKSWKH